MRRTILLLIMIIGLLSLSSCAYIEQGKVGYIEGENHQMAWPINAGYKCKTVQNTDDIVIDIWYAVSKYNVRNEVGNDFNEYESYVETPGFEEILEFRKILEKDYNGSYENKYSDHRFYTLIWQYYDKENASADKYNEWAWYEKAFEIDNFSTYTGSDYKLLKSYTFDDVLNKNNMPYDESIKDLQFSEDFTLHSERINLSKEYFKEKEGFLTIYIGILCHKTGRTGIGNRIGAQLCLYYRIQGKKIIFTKYSY